MAPSLGRRGKLIWLEEGSPTERSESDMRETEDACLAGLIIRRLRSKCPLASEDRAEVLCEVTAEKDRDVWSVRVGDKTGLGEWRGEWEPEEEKAAAGVGHVESR